MLFNFNSKFLTENPLWLGVFVYLAICFVLYATKPQMFFDGSEPRQFGCYGNNDTPQCHDDCDAERRHRDRRLIQSLYA